MPSKCGIFIFGEVWQSRNFHLKKKHPGIFQVPKIHFSPPGTNIFAPLKMDGWEGDRFVLRVPAYFQVHLPFSFREGSLSNIFQDLSLTSAI